jgi:hypothetical protein
MLEQWSVYGCLFLSSRLAAKIYSYVNDSLHTNTIPEFELEYDGIRIIAVRKCSDGEGRKFSETDLSHQDKENTGGEDSR